MPSILLIISKAVFEKDHGRNASLGADLPLAAYHSKHAAMAPLGEGGDLHLVTVRDGSLWLIGVLRRPRFERGSWIAAKNVVPDITPALLASANGKGIDVPPEKLGMHVRGGARCAAPRRSQHDVASPVARASRHRSSLAP